MQLVLKIFFSVWLLSLPFYLYSLVGTLSLDNVLAPVVLTMLLFRLFFIKGNLQRWKLWTIILYGLLFAAYASGRLVSVIENPEYFSYTGMLVLKQFLYLLIPILYINSKQDFVHTSRLIVIVAVVGIFSTLFSSFGLLEFPVARYAESRIGISSLRKAVGLFPNYGDMAMLGSYAILFMFIGDQQGKDVPRQLLKFAATLLMLGGYVGAQSRNMYLTLICGILFVIYLRLTLNRGTGLNVAFGTLVVIGCIAAVAILSFLEISTIESFKGFGGTKESAATVDARLQQYTLAWNIFIEKPIFGHGCSVLDASMEIHNIWLGLMALGGVISTMAVALMFLVPFFKLLTKPFSAEERQLRIFGLAQLICVFTAAEFYGAMTYVFLVIMSALSILPSILLSKDAGRNSAQA